ncbi:hypothetical protein ACROU7_003915, partial [Yersinia enterocolitica]
MALTLLSANNASTVLSAGISASATTLTVNTGTGGLFPSPVSGTSFFKLTLIDAATGTLTEIVHVTARTGDTMTIVRGQEGTVSRLWSANDIAANMMTAGTLDLFAQSGTLGGAALLNVGTTAGTVAAGNDNRITGALQKSANLSDLQSTSTARTNLGLGGAAVLNVGTTVGTVAAGDDPRITASLLKANNLSDLTNVPAALLNLGLGDAAKLGVATDAEVIAGLVGKAITAATLKSRFASVVLYPSGTEAVPPTLTAGQRIVIDNPFPGRPVSAEVEVFANGIWDSPNIMVAPQGNGGPSAGAKAKYLFDSD